VDKSGNDRLSSTGEETLRIPYCILASKAYIWFGRLSRKKPNVPFLFPRVAPLKTLARAGDDVWNRGFGKKNDAIEVGCGDYGESQKKVSREGHFDNSRWIMAVKRFPMWVIPKEGRTADLGDTRPKRGVGGGTTRGRKKLGRRVVRGMNHSLGGSRGRGAEVGGKGLEGKGKRRSKAVVGSGCAYMSRGKTARGG